MTKRSLALVTIAAAVIIAVAAVIYYFLSPEHRRVQNASSSPVIGKAQVGQPAPTFVVATTNGLFDLSKTNRPLVLEVFATWCPHCQRETAVIDRLFRRFRGSVDFLGVSGSDTAMDGTSASSQLDVLRWRQRFNAEYPVAYDPLLNVANLYLQGGFPTIAVIDRNKRVTYLNSGEISYDELRAAIEKVLR